MGKILTSKERNELMRLHHKERDRRVADRVKAVLAYDDGYNYSEIARILLLDDETIRRHVDDYLELRKLATNNGGSESKITDQQSQELLAHLEEITYLHVKDICQYVSQTYGINYSVSGMTQWLHAHQFSYKKPHGVPAKADREKQEQFIKRYNRLKVKAGKKEPIYFADSVHPQHQTKLMYGWILKGERKEIPTTAQQRRLNFIGGICLTGHRFIYRQADQVNAENIVLFLKQLGSNNPGDHTIHLILDNASYHRSKAVKACAKVLCINLHYLPPYSPNLNPIERMWKLMHEEVRYNKFYEKFAEFTDATVDFFKRISRKKRLLRNRITDNFQILHSPMFAS